MAKIDDVTLAIALQEISALKKAHEENAVKIEELESWKRTCSTWAAWWAGVCAAVMTAATLVKAYWAQIEHYFRGN